MRTRHLTKTDRDTIDFLGHIEEYRIECIEAGMSNEEFLSMSVDDMAEDLLNSLSLEARELIDWN